MKLQQRFIRWNGLGICDGLAAGVMVSALKSDAGVVYKGQSCITLIVDMSGLCLVRKFLRFTFSDFLSSCWVRYGWLLHVVLGNPKT